MAPKSRRPKPDPFEGLDDGYHIVHVAGRITRTVSPTIFTLQNFHPSLVAWMEDLLSGNESANRRS